MKKLLPLFVFLISLQLSAQEDAWVFLADKPSATAYLANPLTMLSQRSLDRRLRHNIALDDVDVPVEATYYTQIKNATGITVLAKSKWLNAIHVQGAQSDINNLKTTFTFVSSVEFANRLLNKGAKSSVVKQPANHKNKFEKTNTDFNYGNAANQIQMLKGDVLHQNGYTGAGMYIAVIDAGFPNVNTLAAFARARNNGQILGGYDFVNRNTNFYTGSSHGTNTFSDIAGYLDGVFVGTAPDASYYLFITEDAVNEVPLEESLWVEAVERADSLGVDVINTSLGYTTFDESKYDYSYADMDGNTTFISRGAEIGASRGMILVNSAGNAGNSSWHYMGAPSDAPSVFSVGAVNASGTIASFSSYGPTADNRVKPDVLAQGQSAFVISSASGSAVTSNGTSFSSPIMAGVVACFWQAFPNKTGAQIRQIIRASADRYANPTDHYGYGIPNFETAFNTTLSVNEFALFKDVGIFPNPVFTHFTLKIPNASLSEYGIRIFNILGKEVFQQKELKSTIVDISRLHKGIYILQIIKGNQQKTLKLIKI
ncbi:MAG: S8 family serine peptidase [Flavobacteriaceae bacterium]|nr:S8 family serine peptidase [Flavobacteriaceae bacterium]